MSVLHIISSASPAQSTSTMLGTDVAKSLGGKVTTRNVSSGIPAIDSDWTAANFTPADKRSAEQTERLSLSDTLIAELKAADTIVISAPMYNFSIPSTLRAWIDHVCRAGITFNYSVAGPEGLLKGKRAIVIMTTGGTPVGSDMDFASPYLRHILGFIGITDVEVIAADLIKVDEDKAIASAREAITAL